ncbi:hypothetical protein ASD11_02870 [Aeromicrobium sp. Root495]|nr:hypothetical protein ASD11_02870 [Aeromicrobium sp. Root495]
MLALLGTLVAPSWAGEKDDLNKKKDSVNGKLDAAKQSYDESSKEMAAAVASLNAVRARLAAAKGNLGATRGKLSVARTRDQQMQAKLERSEAALAKAKEELDKGTAQAGRAENQVRQFTLETLQEGDTGLSAFSDLLQGEDPSLFSERISLSDSVADAQIATLQRLDAAKVMLQLNRDEVEKLRDAVAAARKAAAANLERMKVLEQQARKQTIAVAARVSDERSAKLAANEVLAADAQKVRELEAERSRVANQLAALAAKNKRDGGKSSGGDGGGTLSYPVNGPITSPYGMRVHPITGVYKLHDGTDFGVPCGTPVRAAASGTVIQQYFNGAYGNRVLLDNGIKRGVNVVTIYNHLSRFVVSTGSKVKRGQLIAYSGTTGYSTGCHLHFMVLANGATTNPVGWL